MPQPRNVPIAPEIKRPAFGKRAAVPPDTLTIRPDAFPGAPNALARLAGKPIRNPNPRRRK